MMSLSKLLVLSQLWSVLISVAHGVSKSHTDIRTLGYNLWPAGTWKPCHHRCEANLSGLEYHPGQSCYWGPFLGPRLYCSQNLYWYWCLWLLIPSKAYQCQRSQTLLGTTLMSEAHTAVGDMQIWVVCTTPWGYGDIQTWTTTRDHVCVCSSTTAGIYGDPHGPLQCQRLNEVLGSSMSAMLPPRPCESGWFVMLHRAVGLYVSHLVHRAMCESVD